MSPLHAHSSGDWSPQRVKRLEAMMDVYLQGLEAEIQESQRMAAAAKVPDTQHLMQRTDRPQNTLEEDGPCSTEHVTHITTQSNTQINTQTNTPPGAQQILSYTSTVTQAAAVHTPSVEGDNRDKVVEVNKEVNMAACAEGHVETVIEHFYDKLQLGPAPEDELWDIGRLEDFMDSYYQRRQTRHN